MREACGEGGSQTYIVHKTAIGASQGRYNEDITHEYGSSGLSLGLGGYRSYSRRMSYYHDYSVVGGNVAYQFRPELAHGIHTIGIGIWAGREQIGYRPLAPGPPFDATPTNASSRIRLYDFNPYLKGRFGLGTGLGADDGRYLLAGMAVATHEARYNMAFISADIPLGHTGFSFEPYAASNFNRHYQFNLLMHYQLLQKGLAAPATK